MAAALCVLFVVNPLKGIAAWWFVYVVGHIWGTKPPQT
jgi:uncharacterized protein (DUF2062 family)